MLPWVEPSRRAISEVALRQGLRRSAVARDRRSARSARFEQTPPAMALPCRWQENRSAGRPPVCSCSMWIARLLEERRGREGRRSRANTSSYYPRRTAAVLTSFKTPLFLSHIGSYCVVELLRYGIHITNCLGGSYKDAKTACQYLVPANPIIRSIGGSREDGITLTARGNG
jgi:hypothetical protein